MKSHLRRLLWAFALMLFAYGSAYAQFSSAIEGPVTDTSDAIIPSAKVTLTNTDTGVSQHNECNSAGPYRFSALAPGHYKVEVTAPGFTTVTQESEFEKPHTHCDGDYADKVNGISSARSGNDLWWILYNSTLKQD